jgi:hypothetical protein
LLCSRRKRPRRRAAERGDEFASCNGGGHLPAPVLKPKANDTMIGMVVSSGSHNSIHGRMSATGHQVACSGQAYHVRSWSRKPTLPRLAAAPGAGQTGRGRPMSAYPIRQLP